MALSTQKIGFSGWQLAIKKKCIAAELRKAVYRGFSIFSRFALATVTLQGCRAATPPIGGGVAATLHSPKNCQVQGS